MSGTMTRASTVWVSRMVRYICIQSRCTHQQRSDNDASWDDEGVQVDENTTGYFSRSQV